MPQDVHTSRFIMSVKTRYLALFSLHLLQFIVYLLRQFLVDRSLVLDFNVLTFLQAFYRMAFISTQEMIDNRHQMSICEGLRDVMIGPYFVAFRNILELVSCR